MGDPDVWPLFLDIGKEECKRILRRLELEAYSNLVSVLRAQGSLTPQKRRLLQSVAQTLSISEERHKAECRRAVNSEKLATIAKHMGGLNSGTEWAIEGRRLVPLLPRLVPQTAFTAIADKVANMAMTEGAKLPLPTPPAKKILTSPPIDESLLEPSIPEASKTLQISSTSPLSVSIPSCDQHHALPGKSSAPSPSESPMSNQFSPDVSSHSQQEDVCMASPLQSEPVPPVSSHPVPTVKEEGGSGSTLQTLQISAVAPATASLPQTPSQGSQQQQAHKPQVVLLVKKEEKSLDERERLARKRPRSASLDMSLNIPSQGAMLPPPVKKEAISPLSPGPVSPHSHLPCTISPQSHSQLVQQQTLQAAAAAATITSSISSSAVQQQQLAQSSQQATSTTSTPLQLSIAASSLPQANTTALQQATAMPLEQATSTSLPSITFSQSTETLQQQASNVISATSQSSTLTSNQSRTITIPSQGTVKLSLSSSTANPVSGIPTGTHKVIIVSSTTPSILQRSLSVPVVKSLSTSAPSQPGSSAVVLNTAQQTLQSQLTSSTVSTGNSDTFLNAITSSAPTTLPGKVSGKMLQQPGPRARPRANSIVIPVTPNQANVMNSVGVTSVQLKSALQASKQGTLKSSETAGLKIMPLGNMSASTKLVTKGSGSGSMYVVSSTSSASSTVSMVARAVSSGQRVLAYQSLPKVAVSSSQGGNVLSMASKPVQTLQINQPASVVTSSGTIPLSSTSGKPNVIVVQKGSATFGRGVTLSHGGKEVVGKVLLGGKALTSLNQGQTQSAQTLAANSSLNQSIAPMLTVSSSSSQTSQSSVPSTSAAPTRVVTVQKLPSAVVQGSAGSGNVIVLDLSQEQLNNSAVLNEILASSILQSGSVMNFNQANVGEAGNINSLKGFLNFSTEQSDSDSVAESTNGNIKESPRSRTDICAAAMSNANLSLNDLLDDSLDDMQSVPSMSMEADAVNSSENDSLRQGGDEAETKWESDGNTLFTTD